MQPLLIHSSRRRYALLLLMSLVFVAAGVLILLSDRPSADTVGWASVLFSGGCALVFAWQLVDARPRLVFSDSGVLDRTLGLGVIPWTQIDGAYLASISGNAFLCLELQDPQRWIARLGPVRRALVAGNEAIGFTPISLNLSGIAADPEQIHAYVLTMAAASRMRAAE